MAFDWDDNKAASNLSKHGVSFEEAQTVFDDSLYVDFYDPDHSLDEHRYIIVGQWSFVGRVLHRTRRRPSFYQRKRSNPRGANSL